MIPPLPPAPRAENKFFTVALRFGLLAPQRTWRGKPLKPLPAVDRGQPPTLCASFPAGAEVITLGPWGVGRLNDSVRPALFL